MKNFKLFIIVGLSILTACSFAIWFMNKRALERRNAYLTFEGMVLDQYGLPVSGAEITADFPYSRGYTSDGYDRGFRTETDIAYTDSTGHYLFNSTPRRHSYSEVMTENSFDREGNYLQGISHLTFRYDPITGWNDAAVNSFDDKLGWHYVESKKGAPVILRVNRSSGLRQLAYASNIYVRGNVEGGEACFNATDGKLYPTPNKPCDFKIKIGPCNSTDGNWFEISSPDDGGVIWFDGSRMSELEAPPGIYPNKMRLADKECPVDTIADVWGHTYTYPSFFFYSRNRQVYGSVRFDGVGTKKAAAEINFQGWAGLVVNMNPRGERTLTSALSPPNDSMPSLEFPIEIPYKDPWVIDYSKIEVIEDKASKEVRVTGKPGAIMDVDRIWIMNNPDKGEDSQSKEYHGNPDGAFDMSIKADLLGEIYLKINYIPGETYHGASIFVYEPLNKIIKINNDARNKAATNTK